MDFCTYPLARDASRKGGGIQDLDAFYRAAFAHAAKTPVSGMVGQLIAEQAWELAQRPYYNVWPSIVPMLTRLSLDIDSKLVQLPLAALCVRLIEHIKAAKDAPLWPSMASALGLRPTDDWLTDDAGPAPNPGSDERQILIRCSQLAKRWVYIHAKTPPTDPSHLPHLLNDALCRWLEAEAKADCPRHVADRRGQEYGGDSRVLRSKQ